MSGETWELSARHYGVPLRLSFATRRWLSTRLVHKGLTELNLDIPASATRPLSYTGECFICDPQCRISGVASRWTGRIHRRNWENENDPFLPDPPTSSRPAQWLLWGSHEETDSYKTPKREEANERSDIEAMLSRMTLLVTTTREGNQSGGPPRSSGGL